MRRYEQLVAEGDTRVDQVRRGLIHENLRRDYAASKIKEECWDTMAVHGAAVVAFKAPGLAVHNYPLQASDNAAKLAARVAFLRKAGSEVLKEQWSPRRPPHLPTLVS